MLQTQLDDATARRLELSGYVAEHRNDAMRQWLIEAADWQPGDPASFDDLWSQLLERFGYAEQPRADAMLAFYKDQSGSSAEDFMQARFDFWSMETALPITPPPPAGGQTVCPPARPGKPLPAGAL
jgi:hypothetical protein